MTDEPHNEKEDKNRLISLAEAAEMYGYHADHLRHLIHKGRLKAQKFGNSWVTTAADVEDYIRNRKRKGGAYHKDLDSIN